MPVPSSVYWAPRTSADLGIESESSSGSPEYLAAVRFVQLRGIGKRAGVCGTPSQGLFVDATLNTDTVANIIVFMKIRGFVNCKMP